MKFETFKAGVWQQRYQYRSFEPVLVDHEWLWQDPAINTLLEAANRALGELNAFSLIVPDIDLFIEMHVVKEAQTSSRIEGTQTGMDEALMPEDQIEPEKRDDWREVRNYVDAVNAAIAELATLPLSNRLLKRTHEILMRGVRGEHKQPGEFRTSQNWIGGSSLADAVFIPPAHEGVAELMGDLEAFWHNEAIAVPHLVRIAISHYQFETIHPFLDGNGRIGRLLITLLLEHWGLLKTPMLYLSLAFKRHQQDYYTRLGDVRVAGDWEAWTAFYLECVREAALDGVRVAGSIFALLGQDRVRLLRNAAVTVPTVRLLDLLPSNPVITLPLTVDLLGVTKPTAIKAIESLQKIGVIRETTGRRRDRIYAYQAYLDLLTQA